MNNVRFSQIIGWIIGVLLSFFALVCYVIFRSVSKLNYIQSVINSKCKKQMEEAISKAFVDSIVEKVSSAVC